jgi:hypothetical protein
VAFPSAPSDGQQLLIAPSQAVTTLTVTGATISGGSPAALAANTALRYVFSTTAAKWFPA